jgi:aspartyl-tRNA(Asn)/glutamyl-tRNA(Gln) amidotransferase subunit B
MQWETVIGLEIHVQLATASKIFSGSSTAFGAAPNTQASIVDLALPGTLPTPNRQAFRFAALFGLAIGADINRRSVFERKNYFYPDLPKGYQTTQLAEPIVKGGFLDIQDDAGNTKHIRIHHAHLEEDAGKSLHEDFDGYSGIDLNRAGTPLIEVVTEPDLSSSAEAVAFAKKLHALVVALGICDGEMAQGSLRFDVNVSVKPVGESRLGTRTETKNLNSFKFMEEAIELEVARQISLIESGGKVTQETRLYNGDTKKARSMRSKEDANDYRYFPCPDLLPVVLDDSFLAEVRASLPELPDAKRERYQAVLGLSDYDANQVTQDMGMARFFEGLLAAGCEAKLAANWLMGDLSALLNREGLGINESPITIAQLASLIIRISDGTLNSKMAKTVFDGLFETDLDADALIAAKGLKQVNDSGALAGIIDSVLASNPQQLANYRAASDDKRPKMLGFFVGQCMKASQGQANPQQLNELLLQKLNG